MKALYVGYAVVGVVPDEHVSIVESVIGLLSGHVPDVPVIYLDDVGVVGGDCNRRSASVSIDADALGKKIMESDSVTVTRMIKRPPVGCTVGIDPESGKIISVVVNNKSGSYLVIERPDEFGAKVHKAVADMIESGGSGV